MKKPPIRLTNILVFIVTGIFAAVIMPIEAMKNGFDWFEISTCIFLIYFSGMSITGGYHRLWSHKAFDASPVVRSVLAFGGAMALQNSILHWCSDHRIHHRHVDDNDQDPYSAKRGFWFSHIGWMLRHYRQKTTYHDYSNVKDLQRDKVVMFQHNYYLPIMLGANFGVPMLLGWLNGDVWGMLLLAGFFRLVVVHHVTFFINSLAHIWGNQPYTDQNTARDNGILAFFTFGEGYHNYHHIFEYDYRNGIKWWQFDPTKWMIFVFSKLGLAKNLRRCPEERVEKAKLAMQLKRTQNQLSSFANQEELMQVLQAEYDLMVSKMSAFYAAKKTLLDAKKKNILQKYEQLELDQKYKEMKNAFAEQKQKWAEVNRLQFA